MYELKAKIWVYIHGLKAMVHSFQMTPSKLTITSWILSYCSWKLSQYSSYSIQQKVALLTCQQKQNKSVRYPPYDMLCQNLHPEAEHLRMTTWELKIQFLMRETSFSPTSIWRKTPRNPRGENSIFVATEHAQIRHMIS